MAYDLDDRVSKRQMTRRDFLWLSSVTTAGAVTGCVVNPVTGKRQLMLMSEAQEIQIDKENAPHQLSSDYGPVQDQALNAYLTQLGTPMAKLSHRPQMPYSFRVVNATYVNAYAFPGGTIATTRGILLGLGNEAELGGLLGHEIGHVCARHTAQRMTKGMVTGALLAGVVAYVESQHEQYAGAAAALGGLGAGVLLARYSRSDERQADALGMQYMTQAQLNPQGMVGLMELLQSLSKHKPSAIEMMLATHPMSDERYRTAKAAVGTKYKSAQGMELHQERYMDNTARLRQIKGAIEAMQESDAEMAKKRFPQAETALARALRIAPNDYTGLVMMAKCQFLQKKYDQADDYVERAKRANPGEAQAHNVSGLTKLKRNRFAAAYQEFATYERALPGNPDTVFFRGLSQEGMQHKEQAAKEYARYLKLVNQGEQAQHAYKKLVEWGYIKPQPQPGAEQRSS